MSIATFERAILAETRTITKRPKLRKKDILAWSNGELKANNADELVVRLPSLQLNVVIPAK